MRDTQAIRAMVMWRVTLNCWVTDRLASYEANEVFTVEAPENDLHAAKDAGIAKLRAKSPHPIRCVIMRVDVWRLEDRTPPSAIAQQAGLWDNASEESEA